MSSYRQLSAIPQSLPVVLTHVRHLKLIAGNLIRMADKHLRLDSQFHTVCAFWRPEAIDDIHTGTLTVDEDGITFITAPKYRRISMADVSSLKDLLQNREATRLPVLHGFTGNGLCTLCQLMEIDHPGLTDLRSEQSITATAYRAIVCVMGLHFGGVADKCLHSARFTFSGLSDWFPSAASESWDKEFITLKVPLNARDILSVSLRETRIEVHIKVHPELTSSKTDGARLTRSVPYVEIVSPETECLSWYRDIGNRLENLFSLLTGTSIALETIFVYRGEESGNLIQKRNAYARALNPFDYVRCTSSQLANSIAIWLSEPPAFRSIENVALGVLRKGKLFIETEFLSLAQALEGFHRVTTQTTVSDKASVRQIRRKIVALLREEKINDALTQRVCDSLSHVNDPPFATRLASLCGRLSSSLLSRMEIEPEQFVSDVVATRNFYTHTGRTRRMRRKANPVEGPKLFFLNQKMRALLRGIMLDRLEFPEAHLSEFLVREATRWR